MTMLMTMLMMMFQFALHYFRENDYFPLRTVFLGLSLSLSLSLSFLFVFLFLIVDGLKK
jgi:hypothetical protein